MENRTTAAILVELLEDIGNLNDHSYSNYLADVVYVLENLHERVPTCYNIN